VLDSLDELVIRLLAVVACALVAHFLTLRVALAARFLLKLLLSGLL